MFVVLDFFPDKAILVEDILKRLSNINHSEFFPEFSKLEFFLSQMQLCVILTSILGSLYTEN